MQSILFLASPGIENSLFLSCIIPLLVLEGNAVYRGRVEEQTKILRFLLIKNFSF